MLILGLTLTFLGVSIYNNFTYNLYDDMDDLLESKAQGIASSINTYWETQRLEAGREEGRVFTKINDINFSKVAQLWVEEKTSGPKSTYTIVQIYDISGKEIASSENVPDVLELPKSIFETVSKGEEQYDNFTIRTRAGKPLTLRAYTMPVIESGRVSYLVQVASPLDQLFSAQDSLKFLFFIYMPLTAFFTGIGGLFLVNLTLRPVNNIINTIRQITAENMKLRVNIPDTKDEIKRLADTFNDMLSKLDETFTNERRFIQDVSHELKTPLTILKGELEVTLKTIRSQEEYDSVLHSSLEEVDRISRIVDDLLLLAKFDNKQMQLSHISVELNSLIREAINDIAVLAEQKNINIIFRDKEKIDLIADPAYLRRLFLNLLDNAIKFTPEQGMVTLSLTKEGPYAQIKVSDTGPGIPAEELPFIFNRFFRVEKARSSKGFGLGLAIAKSIVEMHAGKIEIQSKAAKGTTFLIRLPL